MFQDAIKQAQQYTLPVIVSYRRQDGTTGSLIGAFIILNEDGWILTAGHIVAQMQEFERDINIHRSSENPQTSSRVTNFSSWWGRDGWCVDNFRLNETADVAIGQITGFVGSNFKTYPIFKNPSYNFDVGQNLCKLGFPFHNIVPEFIEDRNLFQLPPDALPIPYFPIEGIYTRTVKFENSAEFVETSSPGLRGQSGGPTFDAMGRVWALQSRTVHHPLGFSPEAPDNKNREHQFLNCGLGTHAKTIMRILTETGVNFSMSED